MTAFHNLNLHFPDADAFAGWLSDKPKPGWAKGSCFHNTYIPNEKQWSGRISMRSMQKTYEAKGWDRGPHCYLAAGTAFDGIFVMTEPWLPGIHAGECNASRFGLECVGDFASRPMTQYQIQLLTSTAAALHRWAGLLADIVAHRDCMPGRTCPGDAAYAQKPVIQARLHAALRLPYSEDSPILGLPHGEFGAILPKVVSSYYTPFDVGAILGAYWTQALAVDLDPVLAIAQMCHETGWAKDKNSPTLPLSSFWSHRPQRNGCGLGINGQVRYNKPATPGWAFNYQRNRWELGISFETWARHSIPAHLGRLLAYALKPNEGTQAQKDLIDYALDVRPLLLSYRGVAPTLKGLAGTWAVPGVGYPTNLASWANRLVGAV